MWLMGKIVWVTKLCEMVMRTIVIFKPWWGAYHWVSVIGSGYLRVPTKSLKSDSKRHWILAGWRTWSLTTRSPLSPWLWPWLWPWGPRTKGSVHGRPWTSLLGWGLALLHPAAWMGYGGHGQVAASKALEVCTWHLKVSCLYWPWQAMAWPDAGATFLFAVEGMNYWEIKIISSQGEPSFTVYHLHSFTVFRNMPDAQQVQLNDRNRKIHGRYGWILWPIWSALASPCLWDPLASRGKGLKVHWLRWFKI